MGCLIPSFPTKRYLRALVLANRLDYVDLDIVFGRHWREAPDLCMCSIVASAEFKLEGLLSATLNPKP